MIVTPLQLIRNIHKINIVLYVILMYVQSITSKCQQHSESSGGNCFKCILEPDDDCAFVKVETLLDNTISSDNQCKRRELNEAETIVFTDEKPQNYVVDVEGCLSFFSEGLDIPDIFLDSITYEVIKDPVTVSGEYMDRRSLKKLSDEFRKRNPYNSEVASISNDYYQSRGGPYYFNPYHGHLLVKNNSLLETDDTRQLQADINEWFQQQIGTTREEAMSGIA